MEMQYWKNEADEVFGYDVSDASQVEAMQAQMSTGTWVNITGNWPVHTPSSAARNKALATQQLFETDWVNQPDVINTSVNPHLLNQEEFISYRSQLRAIVLNPQDGDLNWPIAPAAQWS